MFTTRPDTLFGATFFVMAPEHPDVLRLAEGTEHEQAVRDYVNHALNESNEERGNAEKPKTGVPLGRTVTNPVNGEQIPMYVADYVLMEYGTGAIMAVPGARRARLRVRARLRPADPARDRRPGQRAPDADPSAAETAEEGLPYTGDGLLVNSHPDFDGMRNREALSAIVAWLDREGKGHASVNYRLRDWLVSRQRYWGCPIPIVYCERCGIVPVPEDQLPVELPDIEDYTPQGPLAAGGRRGLGQHEVPGVRRAGAPRDRHDGHVRRLLVVLPALLRRRATTRPPGIRRRCASGCRSTSTSAASSTRSCT